MLPPWWVNVLSHSTRAEGNHVLRESLKGSGRWFANWVSLGILGGALGRSAGVREQLGRRR